MKKLLSIVVPCFNSQDYMKRCIESLLVGGDDVEIIIVDDGSTDGTAAIADGYAAKYPGICRAIHQPNGGHGEAVNTGLRNAVGEFFKVVDSDDRVNKDAFYKLLDVMRESVREQRGLDMLISNYVYDKQGSRRKKVMKYTSVLPADTYFTWEDIGHFRQTQYILMHSVIYRTELLRQCRLKLPAHTFYVDELFVFKPLPEVRLMYYVDVNFYWYFIGREDQSVNESVMIRRLDQQLCVNRMMIDCFDSDSIKEDKCRIYMKNYLMIVMTVSSVLCILSESKDNLAKKRELWQMLKQQDLWAYRRIRFSIMGVWMNFPGRLGRKISVGGYRVTQKIFGFN